MGASANSAKRGVQGNTANLLKAAPGVSQGRTGTDCKSDTQDLVNKAWVRTNTSGLLSVVLSEDESNNGAGTPVSVYMNAGIASEFMVKRVRITGSEAIAASAIVLLT